MSEQNKKHLVDLKYVLADNRFVGMWRLMKDFRLHFLGATLALGFAALLKPFTFTLIQFLVDDVIANQQLSLLPWVAAGFVGIALLEGAATFLSGWGAASTAEGIARRIRNYLFDHIQRLSFTYHDKAQTGDLIQRSTSDVETINRFFLQQSTGAGRIIFLFIFNFIAIGLIDWELALYSIISIPLIWLLSMFFFNRIEKAYSAYQEQDARVSTTLQENLSGVRVVKAFARQKYEINKFEKENKKKFESGLYLLLNHSVYWPMTDIIAGAQLLLGFGLAATFVIDGRISLGDYLAYIGMIGWILWPMRNLGRLIVQMSQAFVSYDRIAAIIKEDREPMDLQAYTPKGDLRGEIVFENVNFAYEGHEAVLHNINMHVKPGQVIALMGSTGSGKTSIVNLLPRFYDYQSGRILLDGLPLADYSRHYLRSQIGIVEQEPFLFSRSIRENIAYGVGRAVTDDEVFAAARAAAIHDVIEGFPEGYKTVVGERGVTLSGGQKQRIAVARTLLKNPRILILDDATSSVDTETEAEIRLALENLMGSRTTFIIAHRIQTVMHADQIIVFDKGHIVQQGTHSELLRSKTGIYNRIFDVQAKIEDELERDLASVDA